jgi:hypothetical protein
LYFTNKSHFSQRRLSQNELLHNIKDIYIYIMEFCNFCWSHYYKMTQKRNILYNGIMFSLYTVQCAVRLASYNASLHGKYRSLKSISLRISILEFRFRMNDAACKCRSIIAIFLTSGRLASLHCSFVPSSRKLWAQWSLTLTFHSSLVSITFPFFTPIHQFSHYWDL